MNRVIPSYIPAWQREENRKKKEEGRRKKGERRKETEESLQETFRHEYKAPRKVARFVENGDFEVKCELLKPKQDILLTQVGYLPRPETEERSRWVNQQLPPKCAPQYYPKEDMKSVRLNLPSLVVPARLMQPEEDAMGNLRILLRHHGFDVRDRATLAFFSIGKQYDVQSAAKCLQNFYKLVNTAAFISPNRNKLEQMEVDGLCEGFARHHDRTMGSLINLQKFNFSHHSAPYITREVLCYILNMADLELLRAGLTNVTNARNFTWRQFVPFEKAKTAFLLRSCMPLHTRRRIVIDIGIYGRLARCALDPLLPDIRIRDKTFLISLEEARLLFPEIILPESLTGLKGNLLIKKLSANEQMKFKFLL